MDTKGRGEPWGPLPEGVGANPLIRRLKAVDAEIYGNIHAHSGAITGDFDVSGDLTVTGDIDTTGDLRVLSGGTFATGLSNGTRLEIQGTSGTTDKVISDYYLYTGSSATHVLEDKVSYSGGSTTRKVDFNPEGTFSGFYYDGGSTASSTLSIRSIYAGSLSEISLTNTADSHSVYMSSDGVFSRPSAAGTGTFEFKIGNPLAVIAEISSTGIDAKVGLTLPVKTTTGDPSSPPEGYTYVNTSDKKVRTYAGSAWRDLATW